jgi:hypothetical protein
MAAAPTTSDLMPNVTQLGSIKLEGPNYLGWVAQFQPILCGYELQGLLDGSDPCPPKLIANIDGNGEIPNPAYVSWLRRDQQLLNLIICSLAPPLVPSMYGLKTSQLAWSSLATRFAAQSKSRISHLKRQLQRLQQGNKTCTEYLSQAKTWSDELSAVGKPVEDDDLISYVINGINPIYNSFVTAFTLRDRETTFHDFQSELLSHEILLQNQQQTLNPEAGSFALHVNRFRPPHQPNNFHSPPPNFRPSPNNFRKPKPFPRPPGQFRQSTPPNHYSPRHPTPPSPNTSFGNHPTNGATQPPRQYSPCQICGKTSHRALDCYHRMDYAYQGRHPPMQLVAMTAQTNEEFTNQEWLADSGANTHITADSSLLTESQPFDGSETVGVGNGTGLLIHNTGSSIVQSPNSASSKLLLSQILHCPAASANLLSINKFCKDNKCWFALTDIDFTVKDNLTGKILLHGPSENGLYPIRLHPHSLNKASGFTALLGVKTTDMVWHQ